MSDSLKFKEKRKELKMTQVEVSQTYGVSVRSIQRYEAGDVEIPYFIQTHFFNLTEDRKMESHTPDTSSIGEIINSHNLIYFSHIEGHGAYVVFADFLPCGEKLSLGYAIAGQSTGTIGLYLTGPDRIDVPADYHDKDDELGVCLVINALAEFAPWGVNVEMGIEVGNGPEFHVPSIKDRMNEKFDSSILADGKRYILVNEFHPCGDLTLSYMNIENTRMGKDG